MRTFILSTTLLLLLASCETRDRKAPLVKAAESSSPAAKKKTPYIPVVKYGPEGFYTGLFVRDAYDKSKTSFDNKITICIDSLDESRIYGHSVVAGNDRPFTGTYQRTDDHYECEADEPGNEAYDGSFHFTISLDSKKLSGTWKAKNRSVTVRERSYELKLRPFRYKANQYLPELLVGMPLYDNKESEEDTEEMITHDAIRINASTDHLTPGVVENLYRGDLELIRNAVYARHGYSFRNPRMRTLFDYYVPWYMPVSTDVTGQLTALEKKNIALILRYEKHAEKYEESFGR